MSDLVVLMVVVISVMVINWSALVYALDPEELRGVVRRDSGVLIHTALITLILIAYIPAVSAIIITLWFKSRVHA